MGTKRIQTIKVKDYGNEELNRLAVAVDALDSMTPDERLRAFNFLKSRYSKEWPTEAY